MSNLSLEKTFICVDGIDKNSNKFWKIRVYQDGTLETEYGRVGDNGSTTTKSFGDEDSALYEAEKMMNKKKKGKKKNGRRESVYKEVEIVGQVDKASASAGRSIGKRVYESIADGDKTVMSLIELLDKQNIHNITSGTSLTYDVDTGLFSTPLGVVGQNNIDQARDVLAKMKPHVERGVISKDSDKLAEEFMMLIPQNIGRMRPRLENVCPTLSKLNELNSILDSLQASLDVIMTQDDDDKADNSVDFGVKLIIMDKKRETNRLNKFFNETRNSKHTSYGMKMRKIYSITHNDMEMNFENHGKKLGNIMELWHGTRVGNVLSILAKGMVIPPSSASYCTGRMYGNGVYFSDQSTKSLNYAQGYWSGTREQHCFMFLFEVAMGKMFTPADRYSRGNLPRPGYDSTFAKAGTSGVLNNEMIIYNVSQCKPKYLIEFGS